MRQWVARSSRAYAWIVGPVLLMLAVGMGAWARAWEAVVDVGDIRDRAFLAGFHGREYETEQEVSFRWSQPAAMIMLRGSGRDTVATLRVHGREAGEGMVLDIGAGAVDVVLRGGWEELHVMPRVTPIYGNSTLHISTEGHRGPDDPRVLGIVVERVVVSGSGGGVMGHILAWGGYVALVTVLVGWVFDRRWVGSGSGLVVGLVIGWVSLTDDGWMRLMIMRLTGVSGLVLGGSMVLAGCLVVVLRWLGERGVPGCRHGAIRRGIVGAVLLGFVMRYAGLAHPLTYTSDIPIHMARASKILAGEFWELFLPNPSLAPVQWGQAVPIPYSPFYYLLITPMLLLPHDWDELVIEGFGALVDAVGTVALALLVLLGGFGGRAAIGAAVMAGIVPFGVLLAVSWGLMPTLLGQCLALVALATWLAMRNGVGGKAVPWLVLGMLTAGTRRKPRDFSPCG